ncbi:UNVERIFIED_CONTAM: hypothetical protein GTU68_057744 [Idotea baltica]|nr:hypothetical protein [Idotea baltica]
MDFQELIEAITPDIYNKLKSAVELGKWPDGTQLTPMQKENTLQAIIAYDAHHKAEDERVGYIPPKEKGASSSNKGKDNANDEQPIKWEE